MKRQICAIGLAGLSVISALSVTASPSMAIGKELEKMTDRCSGEVIIVPRYNAPLDTPGAILLKRDKSGETPLSDSLRVDSRQIRWYCNSKSQFKNLDPGTWRIQEVQLGSECKDDPSGTIACKPSGSIKLGSSAKDGWFVERSRCPEQTTNIQAKLGKDRLLRIICYK
jgi:hypothetical protein